MRRLPCGIRTDLPVALSRTFWLTCARIGPRRSELIPLIRTAGTTLPAITVYGDGAGNAYCWIVLITGSIRVGLLSFCARDLECSAAMKSLHHFRGFERLHVLLFGPLRIPARRLRRPGLNGWLRDRHDRFNRHHRRCRVRHGAISREVLDFAAV